MINIYEQNLDLLKSKERLLWRNITLISDFPEDCWLWNKSVNSGGYGRISLGESPDGKHIMIQAHRLSYLLYVGPIPENLLVLHTCDEPRCCNPSHLFLGTQKDNVEDMHKKDRGHTRKEYTHSSETRSKISQALKGRIFSEETRAKMSESAKNRRSSQ